MKRLLVLNYEFPPLGGGGGVAAYNLAKGFIQNGYEVDYLTTGFKGLKKFEVVDGINVYRVPVIGRKGLQTATMISLLSFPLAALWQGIMLCRKYEYDFINTHFVVPTGPLGYLLSKLFKIKNILSLHGGDIYDPSKKSSPHRFFITHRVVRFLINNADVVVAQSSNTKANAVEYYGITRPIEIIPLAYEPHSFTPVSKEGLGLDSNKKYIVGVGRMVARKDFSTFIKVIAALDNTVHGIIIGDGPERPMLEKLAKTLNVTERLHLVGQVSEEKKFQYLAVSDVFLLSSLHEGFGIVLQEAMQVGLPIVATNNGGQVDLIDDTKNGFLTNIGDIADITNKLNNLLAFEDKRKDIAKLNKFYITKFNIKNIATSHQLLV